MSRFSVRVGLLLAVAAAFGCGEDKAAPARTTGGISGGSGSTEDGGTEGGSDAGPEDAGPDAMGGGDPLAPNVRVQAPFNTDDVGAFDVDEDELITNPRIDVVCRVEENELSGDEIDPGSVEVKVTSLEPDPPAPVTASASRDGEDEFRASVNIEALPAGAIQIDCMASDRSTPTRTGMGTGYTYLDKGPVITVLSPSEGQAFAGLDELIAEVAVEPSPLTEDDDEATAIEASFFINGKELTGELVTQNGISYTFLLDFDDTEYFQTGLTSASVRVEARNGRTPLAASSEVNVPMIVDDLGPVIDFRRPSDQEIVAGEETVVVRVDDAASGVVPESVRIEIANGDAITMEHNGGVEYSHTFATRAYDPQPVLTLQVTAEDQVGNSTTEDILLYLDNVRPWISMDPPTMRAVDARSAPACSPEFDPLGGALLGGLGGNDQTLWGRHMPNDGDTVLEQVMLRAFIYDRTNQAAGASSVRFSGIVHDPLPELWIQRNPSVPLLVDTNGDGYCDDINSAPEAGQTMPSSFNLDPLGQTPLSSMPRNRDLSFDGGDPVLESSALGAPSVAGCVALGGSGVTEPQTGDCPNAPMFTLRHQQMQGSTPIIYAFNPNGLNSDVDCRGQTIPLQIPEANFSDWVCMAVRAYDEAGNRSVSAPHRLCVDKNNGGTVCEGAATPPSCLAADCIMEPTGALGDGGPKDIPDDVSRVYIYD